MLEVTKSWGPDGIRPPLLQKLSMPNGINLNIVFWTVKRLRTLQTCGRSERSLQIHKTRSETSVANYRPVTLLNVISKVFEKCVHELVNSFFMEKIAHQQRGFIKKKSVYTVLLNYLNKVFTALDDTGTNEVTSFYTGFAKAFDILPHAGLIFKWQRLGVIDASFINRQTISKNQSILSE